MMKTTKIVILLSLTFVVSSSAPQQAEAMAVMPWEIFFYPMTSTTAGLSITVTASGVVTTIAAHRSTPDKTALVMYVRDNTIALQHDIYLGGGPAILDLAALLGVHHSQSSELAAYLFTHRQRIAPLVLAAHDSDDAAREFLDFITIAQDSYSSL